MYPAKDFIVLDFFSGSATTAHAVMQLNAEDGGHRKFIMVQLPEKCDEKSEAYKAGYKNICEIGKERIRRAGDKIKSESPMTTQDLDVGFRVLKLDDTNMNKEKTGQYLSFRSIPIPDKSNRKNWCWVIDAAELNRVLMLLRLPTLRDGNDDIVLKDESVELRLEQNKKIRIVKAKEKVRFEAV